MWGLGTWFRGGLGSAGLTLELNDLKGLLKPKESVIAMKKIRVISLDL